MLSMTCSCKGEFWVRDRLAGNSTPCPSCGLSLDVPPFETVRADMTPATCSCGEIFWSSAWQPGKLSRCPICGDVVGPSESAGETTVILPPQSMHTPGPALKAQGGPAQPIHAREQPDARGTAGQTTAASTTETPPADKPEERGRRLASAGAAVLLLAAGVLLGSRWAGPLENDDPGSPPVAPREGGEGRREVDAWPPPSPIDQGPQAPLKILVPAYFFPAASGLDDWKRLLTSARRVPIVAVVNPASGPGELPNRDYADIVRGGTATAGLTMIGYVNTAFATRPRPEIEADIDRWVRFYPEIQGIFLDAQSSEGQNEDFYADLSDYVRRSIDGAIVVTNPGTACAEGYFESGAADIAIVFENSHGFDEFELPLWRFRYPPGRFAAVPYAVKTAEAMEDAIRQAGEKGIGYLFVTDGVMPNPWRSLPPYWAELVDAVEAVNAGPPREGL
ncbi:spherulation-specific family 4 protein [Tautonia plasticadhaerens]|uniref:Spherulation-specific family 4 n=1 Tax=Tautonia plasticadhaerens TaxID=2527974 RepID=A0A518HBN0_9BACT|nr:spherulation-specific family 4 protein [Tautonia plasticadhaerens]QDV38227.1 Spherulation-specific family 4 [Tautonia plasticadhaerens]